MKVVFIFVALSSYVALCHGQSGNPIVEYLNQLGAGEDSIHAFLNRILQPQNIDRVVDCIIARGQLEGCDPRSNTVRVLIPLLMSTNLQCHSCDPAVKETVHRFSSAIRSNPNACGRLAKELQVEFNEVCRFK